MSDAMVVAVVVAAMVMMLVVAIVVMVLLPSAFHAACFLYATIFSLDGATALFGPDATLCQKWDS
jgi:hypothetical protein